MLGHIVRAVVRVLVSSMLCAALGALYAGLIGAVHLGVSGRWDQIPVFAKGCVLVGALLGLLGRIAWDLMQDSFASAISCSPKRLTPTAVAPQCRRSNWSAPISQHSEARGPYSARSWRTVSMV